MNNILTFKEINEQYQSEWVLLENPETNEQSEIMKGAVLYHSKNRDEVYRKAIELKPKYTAFLYTGEIPSDSAVIL